MGTDLWEHAHTYQKKKEHAHFDGKIVWYTSIFIGQYNSHTEINMFLLACFKPQL